MAPWAGVGFADGERGYRLGYAFHAGGPSTTDVRIELVAARREPAHAAPEHTFSIEWTLTAFPVSALRCGVRAAIVAA